MRTAVLLFALMGAPLCFADIQITEGYVRSPIPGQRTLAAYLTIENQGGRHCELVGAGSAAASRVELHGHLHGNGAVAMRQVATLPVESGAQVRLQPGGHHLMLFDVELAPGSANVPVALDLGNCGIFELDLPLRSVLEEASVTGEVPSPEARKPAAPFSTPPVNSVGSTDSHASHAALHHHERPGSAPEERP